MVAAIHSLSGSLSRAINSERSRLSGSAIKLVTALSTGLGPAFEPLIASFIRALLGLCARTNKLFVSRAKACIITVIEHTQSPSILSYLAESILHRSSSLRLAAAEGVLACLRSSNHPDDTCSRLIEGIIKSTSRDASEGVRETAKQIYKAYKDILPADRFVPNVSIHYDISHILFSLIAPLSPVVNKRMDVQGTAPSRTMPLALPRSRLTTGTVKHVGSSARQSALCAPLEAGSSSTQSANPRRDIIRPVVPTTRRPQRVTNMPMRTRGDKPRFEKGTRTSPSAKTTEGVHISRTVQNTLQVPQPVESTPAGSSLKPLISRPTKRVTSSRSGQPQTAISGVKLRTPSQASHKKAIALRSSWRAADQRKSMSTVTKAPVVKASFTPSKILGGVKGHGPVLKDVPLSPSAVLVPPSTVSCQFEPVTMKKPPVQGSTTEHVPRDVNPPCTDDTPSFLPPPTQQAMLLTPSRNSYMADPLRRAPRRLRHAPKRRECTDRRGDSICIDTIPPSCDASANRSEIRSAPLASCIPCELFFTPPSHDDAAQVQQDADRSPYHLRRVPRRPRRAAPRRTNRDYARTDATPLPVERDAEAPAGVAMAHATSNPAAAAASCVTLYAGCELRRVVEGLTDLHLDPAMFLFYGM